MATTLKLSADPPGRRTAQIVADPVVRPLAGAVGLGREPGPRHDDGPGRARTADDRGGHHLPIRWRFVLRATAGARFIDTADDPDLFALRALTRQSMHVLARVSDDPAGAWRNRDPDIVRTLAELELRSSGLTIPARLRT